ncbi:MAG: NYN domain-containing protein [Desulfatibacillaceae bacterium]
MIRVCFLVDGFNLYHSTREAQRDLGTSTKWLNIKQMLYNYHPHYTSVAGEKVRLGEVYYFSAYAHHRTAIDPGVVGRHQSLINCLVDTGIHVKMHQFKQKAAVCPSCKHKWFNHEEKETDVAISVKLVEIFVESDCNMAVILSGDTDIAPAVRSVNKIFSKNRVIFAFPYRRKNKMLEQLAPGSFKIKSSAYKFNQFSDPYRCKDGTIIHKPTSW